MGHTTLVTELPEDILHLIVAYLIPSDFLAFASTSSILHDNDSIRLSASYWRTACSRSFRVPNHPVAANDGRRWMQLYRRMRTQTHVYTWGNNDGGCLGGGLEIGTFSARPMLAGMRGRGGFGRGPPQMIARTSLNNVSWPMETKMGQIGVVADLQCGGYSTTALSDKGELWVLGILDGRSDNFGVPRPVPHRLRFPAGFANPGERYSAFTAISQFSSGRCHVLGLSDSGRIWSWDDTARPGLHVKFLGIDMVESRDGKLSKKAGRVRHVVAGWSMSSAYILGKGIVCWNSSNDAELQGSADQSEVDTMLVLESWIVPGTSFIRTGDSKLRQDELAAEVGEVTNWVVLEHYILFTTHTGAFYGAQIPTSREDIAAAIKPPLRLNSKLSLSDAAAYPEHVIDVQGSFRSFAVFKRNGNVLVGDDVYLDAVIRHYNHGHDANNNINSSTSDAKLRKIPALQNSGVIAMAFADYHSHALHSNGTISSYGHEPRSCGALGLGGQGAQLLRGVRPGVPVPPDGMLQSECFTSGRRVCFEPEKREWLDWIKLGGKGNQEIQGESERRRNMMNLAKVRAEVSEWVEEKLRRWELDAPPKSHEPQGEDEAEDEDDGLPTYFALSVAAAGWHSGSLVLVNQVKAKRIRERYRVDAISPPASSVWDMARSFVSSLAGSEGRKTPEWIWEARGETFPRLKLKDGEILPGTAGTVELPDELRDWKEVEWVDL